MVKENVELPERQAAFIREIVAAGRYESVSEAVRAGVNLLEQCLAEEAKQQDALRTLLEEAQASGMSERTPLEVWAAVESRFKSDGG